MRTESMSCPPPATAERVAALIEPFTASARSRCLGQLGYRLHPVGIELLDSFEPDPEGLAWTVRAQLSDESDPALLVLACDGLTAQAVGTTVDWEAALHKPLTRCFTAVRGLAPWIMGRPGGGHIVAILPRSALVPHAAGTAAVLGRAILGLLESLRAELRQTPTRVTICIADSGEPVEAWCRRLQHMTSRRPFHSLPVSINPDVIGSYFAPMLAALEQTPRGVPLPAGPRGEVYDLERLEDSLV